MSKGKLTIFIVVYIMIMMLVGSIIHQKVGFFVYGLYVFIVFGVLWLIVSFLEKKHGKNRTENSLKKSSIKKAEE